MCSFGLIMCVLKTCLMPNYKGYFYYRSMDLLDTLREKVESKYLDNHDDRKETRVSKTVKIFHEQVEKGVAEMEV